MAKIIAGAALIAGAAILTVATGGVGAVVAVAESGELGAAFGAMIGGAALGGAQLLTSGIADALHLNSSGQAFSAHQPFKPWQIVYGRQRVSGTLIDCSISDGGNGDNRWLWQVEVLAAHSVEGILATYLNQQQVFVDTSRGLGGTNGLTGNLIGTNSTDGGNMDVNGMALEIHPYDLNFRKYDNFYFDGNPRFWMAQYDGTQTAADPFYMALCQQSVGPGAGNGIPHWTSDCIVQGMAYSLNRYWANANWATGAPAVRYDVKGKKDIYDPRNGTYGYTENAALILADYMCNQQYGMMYDIADFDHDTLIAAANICDETVTLTNPQIIFNTSYSTEARYAINGTLSTSTSGGTVIEQMLGAMAGRISYIGGQWYIFPGSYQGTSGVSLTSTDLIGGIQWSPNRKSRDLFNEVRALFTCPSGWDTTLAPGFDVYNVTAQTVEDYFNGQWMRIDMPPFCFNSLRDYASDPYLAADNNVKYIQQVDFPYTISVACAQRLAKILLLRNRMQGTGTLTLPINHLAIQPNDIITVTYPRFGWTNKQLEVQGTRINLGGTDSDGKFTAPSITVNVAEVDSSIYSWSASDELKLQGGQWVSGPSLYSLSGPTNLVLTSNDSTAQLLPSGLMAPSILATWNSPSEAWITGGGKIVVQLAPGGSTAYQTVATLDGATTGYNITGVSSGVQYSVNVYAINAQGAMSSGVSGTVTVGGGSTAGISIPWLPDPVRKWPVSGVETINPTYVVYSNGSTIDSLKPAQPGADVTGSNTSLNTSNVGNQTAAAVAGAATAVAVQNPTFAAGVVGWDMQGGWTISPAIPANGVPIPPSGSAYVAQFNGSSTSGIFNHQKIPCQAGDILSANCWIYGSPGAGGRTVLEIRFYSANGTYLSGPPTPDAAASVGFQPYRVVASAPANAAFAQIDFANYGGTQAGTVWFCADVSVTLNPRSLSEIPDGGGRYAAVETGADNTRNHVLTTVAKYNVSTNYTAVEIAQVPGLSWSVTVNDTSDSFDINAVVAFNPTANHYQNVQMLALVDGVVSSQFGCGFSQGTTTAGLPYPGTFFGSVTGLAPGTHTITLYYADANNRGFAPSESVADAWGTIQQISS